MKCFTVYSDNGCVVKKFSHFSAVTCGLLRMNLGMRGLFAGSVIGSVLGYESAIV